MALAEWDVAVVKALIGLFSNFLKNYVVVSFSLISRT